jgi:hypothetical protein
VGGSSEKGAARRADALPSDAGFVETQCIGQIIGPPPQPPNVALNAALPDRAPLSVKEFESRVPDALKQRRWVAWGPDPKTARPKCPLAISDKERRASTRKPETWQEWKSALAFYGKYADGKTLGVGFVFTLEDQLVYVDVDDALDAKGELRAWAKPFVEPFVGCAYIETSPGGRGLHIIARGTLPGGCTGGKTNFPQHASGDVLTGAKIPEVAMFAHGKYTTVTGRVWKKNAALGDGTAAAQLVWAAAGIKAIAVDGPVGAAPPDEELPEVDKRKLPKSVRDELKDCTAADADDRSAARFKLYADAAQKLEPEEIFALVLEHDEWFQSSGAAEKGREATWADIQRSVAKAETAAKVFEATKEQNAEENEKLAVVWKELGIKVISEMTKSGPVHRAVYSGYNAARVLAHHPGWQGRIRLNQFKERLELDGKQFTEEQYTLIAEEVRAYLLWDREPQLDVIIRAVALAATEQAYHPVQQMLRGLAWDRVARIDEWLVRAGCEDSRLTRLIGRKWIISLVARALLPGCKVDTVLVLEGAQGRRKSTLLETLVGGRDYFTDAHVTFDKDGQMLMHGSWIVELAELATFQKAEQLRTKQFISSPDLSFRAPYGRVTVTRPRHFVLVGTTNDDEYLTDQTGNRRYWPVRVEAQKLDLAWLASTREQLLAEAVVAFEAGEQWWFDEEPEDLEEAREARMESNALADKIARYVFEREQNETDAVKRQFTIEELMEACSWPVESKRTVMDVARGLRALGLKKEKRLVKGLRQWRWRKPNWLELVGASETATVGTTGGGGECPTPATAKVGHEVGHDEDLSDVM